MQALGPFSRKGHREGGGNRVALESYCRESPEREWERKKMYLSERMVGMFQYIDEEERTGCNCDERANNFNIEHVTLSREYI